MINFSNKGMYLETLINLTAQYLSRDKIALIFKRDIPISIYKRDGNNIIGKLKSKSTTDYYGVYKGKLIDFEAKQTSDEYFRISNLKEHQLNHLNNINDYGGFSFLMLYYVKYDQFYCITYKLLETLLSETKINIKWCNENAFKLNIIFPGILDIENFLKKIICV